MYRLFFPMVTDNRNDIVDYEIGIIPETCGFVNNLWWHKTMEMRFETPLDALAFAEDILLARLAERDCPCGEGCIFNSKKELNPAISRILHTGDGRTGEFRHD